MAKTKTEEKIAIAVAIGAIGTGAYFALKEYLPDIFPCKEGETKCKDSDLYSCVDGKWALTERNSPQCIIDEGWVGANQIIAEKTFALSVVSGGWMNANEVIGEKSFNLSVVSGGWFNANEVLGNELFSIYVEEALEQYTLGYTVEPYSAGYVTKNPLKDKYAYGEIVKLTAFSYSPGIYEFESWWAEDEFLGTGNPINFMVTGNCIITAYFHWIF